MPITSSFHFPAGGPGEGPLPFCDPDAGIAGSFGAPPARRGETPRPCRCPFALAPEEEMQAVGRTCHATIGRESVVPLVRAASAQRRAHDGRRRL
jgi:hypothetical protein